MANTTIQNAVLLRTSSANDLKCSGGELSITGIPGTVSKKDITSIFQLKYRAEVAQVVTVGSTSYTPANSTTYTVFVYDPLRVQAGYQESPKGYSYTTPADVTTLGNAAAQREAIHVAIVAAINNDPSNHAVAASLGSGNGFTVTDDGSYYPVFAQGQTNVRGANTVYTVYNSDGTGFGNTNFSITTAAVYAAGVGATLAQKAPVVDFMYGNLISGVLVAPPLTSTGLPAVSGQKYDEFVISCLKVVAAHQVTGQFCYQERVIRIYVDNGAGASTTNLAGFQAFERDILTHLFDCFRFDPASIIYMGDNGVVCGGASTGDPSGVAQSENYVQFGNGFTAHYQPITTATGVALYNTATGMVLNSDANAGEGVEVSAPTYTSSQKQFVVGQQAASVYVKANIDDVTGLNPYWVGFRKKAAYGPTFADYTDYAVIGLGNATGDIYTFRSVNATGMTGVDSGSNWADNETHTLEVNVDINGVVTYRLDGYGVTGYASATFDAGDVMIPVFGWAQQASDIGTVFEKELAFVTSDSWRA